MMVMLFRARLLNMLITNRKTTFFVLLNMLVFSGNWYLYTTERGAQRDAEIQHSARLWRLARLQRQLAEARATTQRSFSPWREHQNDNDTNTDTDTEGAPGFGLGPAGRSVIMKHQKQGDDQASGPSPFDLSGALRRTAPTPDDAAAAPGQPYAVPSIQYTKLVNCAALLGNDTAELVRARRVLLMKPKVPIYEETYMEWARDCADFRRRRGYVEMPLSEEERRLPLAFSISMYTDLEMAERLLRAIYQPQNVYCIHVDTKSSLLLHRAVSSIAACFDNVFIASHLDKIKWGDASVLLPALNCMRDLDRYYRGRWKYFINLTGQELPLRTNWELVQIANIFNGSNDIAGSIKSVESNRVKHKWTHRWSKTYQQTIFYDTFMPKSPPPYNLTFFKGELHGLFSQRMVAFIVHSDVSKAYLTWCLDSGHPSEHYWNTLNYNVHIDAPGGYIGPLELAEAYSPNPVIRAKHWQDQNYGARVCAGKIVRGICVYGVGDAPWLAQRPELFANKFHMTFEYLTYDCLEQRHRERTKMGTRVPFNADFYKSLPTVKYSRKDGYFQNS